MSTSWLWSNYRWWIARLQQVMEWWDLRWNLLAGHVQCRGLKWLEWNNKGKYWVRKQLNCRGEYVSCWMLVVWVTLDSKLPARSQGESVVYVVSSWVYGVGAVKMAELIWTGLNRCKWCSCKWSYIKLRMMAAVAGAMNWCHGCDSEWELEVCRGETQWCWVNDRTTRSKNECLTGSAYEMVEIQAKLPCQFPKLTGIDGLWTMGLTSCGLLRASLADGQDLEVGNTIKAIKDIYRRGITYFFYLEFLERTTTRVCYSLFSSSLLLIMMNSINMSS